MAYVIRGNLGRAARPPVAGFVCLPLGFITNPRRMKTFNNRMVWVVALAVVVIVAVAGLVWFYSNTPPTTAAQYATALLQNLSSGDMTSEQCASAASDLENTLTQNSVANPNATEDVQDSAYLYNKHRCVALVMGSASSSSGYWAIVDVATQSELYRCDTSTCSSSVFTPPSYLDTDDVFAALKAAGGQ